MKIEIRMKKIVYVFLLLVIPFVGHSQSMFELSGFGKAGFDIRTQPMYTAGAHFEWQPKSGNLGLNYSLRFGRDKDANFLFQCPISALTSIFAVAFLADCDSDLPGIGLLLCLIPEGLSYNIWMNEDFAITPYVNPLLLEVSTEHVAPVLEAGAKMKVFCGKYIFGCAELGLQMPYTTQMISTWTGLSLGVRF